MINQPLCFLSVPSHSLKCFIFVSRKKMNLQGKKKLLANLALVTTYSSSPMQQISNPIVTSLFQVPSAVTWTSATGS